MRSFISNRKSVNIVLISVGMITILGFIIAGKLMEIVLVASLVFFGYIAYQYSILQNKLNELENESKEMRAQNNELKKKKIELRNDIFKKQVKPKKKRKRTRGH